MPDGRILVTRSSMPAFEEYCEEIRPLWESHWLTNMGAEHKKLEEALKGYLGVENVCLYSNGHLALECALEALGLGADGRRKVITTPYTFASTTHAIVRKGLEPVFCDVRSSDCTIDPERIEALVDDQTCAIVPVHVYGNLCDDAAIKEIADRHGLKVVYDAAHAFGVERLLPCGEGLSAAAMGDISMFSFHATKVFNTVEGGALCFRDPALKPILDQWKNFGIAGPDDAAYAGGNAKLDEFRAAMGVCNLRHLDGEIAKRRRVAERYWDNLEGVPGLTLFRPSDGVRHNYAYLPVVFGEGFGATRDDVFGALDAIGVGARRYFHPLTSAMSCYRGRFDPGATPVAGYLASHVLTLPMYADLALEDVDRICACVRGCAR